MADAEDIITVKNLQAEYDRLTSEIPTKASELSIIYKSIEKAKSDLAEITDKKGVIEKECAIQLAEVEDARKNLAKREEDSKEEIRRLEVQHKHQAALTKDAIKELERRNAQVLAAIEEHDRYKALIADLELKTAEYANLVAQIEHERVTLLLLDNEKTKILQDISTETEAHEIKLKVARDELSTLVHLADEKRKEAAQAQARVKTYTDELYTHMNDYQVVKARIEQVWNKTFPELELPL